MKRWPQESNDTCPNLTNHGFSPVCDVKSNLYLNQLALCFLPRKVIQVPNILFTCDSHEELLSCLKVLTFVSTLVKDYFAFGKMVRFISCFSEIYFPSL